MPIYSAYTVASYFSDLTADEKQQISQTLDHIKFIKGQLEILDSTSLQYVLCFLTITLTLLTESFIEDEWASLLACCLSFLVRSEFYNLLSGQSAMPFIIRNFWEAGAGSALDLMSYRTNQKIKFLVDLKEELATLESRRDNLMSRDKALCVQDTMTMALVPATCFFSKKSSGLFRGIATALVNYILSSGDNLLSRQSFVSNDVGFQFSSN